MVVKDDPRTVSRALVKQREPGGMGVYDRDRRDRGGWRIWVSQYGAYPAGKRTRVQPPRTHIIKARYGDVHV